MAIRFQIQVDFATMSRNYHTVTGDQTRIYLVLKQMTLKKKTTCTRFGRTRIFETELH